MTDASADPWVGVPDPGRLNHEELIRDYGLKGPLKGLRLNLRLGWQLVLSALAKRAPMPGLAVMLQRWRGVRIGKHVYIGPGVEIDFLYPSKVTIEDYVSIGMHTMVFAHSNPTCSILLKTRLYPRTVLPVRLSKGAWIPPGCIILPGVTIGENAVVGAGSVVIKSVGPGMLAAGNPAKEIKRLDIPVSAPATPAPPAGRPPTGSA